ncbi:hypothetical protein [Roseobacter sp. S98]|uniref:hypothetical protein n=1 Tax=Roseobacter algicola (ex Choi et al. 2025) (nom. illeg.) TaxID=3092138 RepID=UPI0035C77EA9
MLGVVQTLLWTAQHPLESPFYRTVGNSTLGLAEGILYAKAFGLSFGFLLLLFPRCLPNVAELVRDRTRVCYILASVGLGYVSLSLYAYAQSRLPGVVISIILTSSPLSYSVALDYLKNRELSWRARVRKYVTDRHIHVHTALSFGVGLIMYLQSDKWFFEPLAGVSAFFVPLAFFMSYNLLSLATDLRDQNVAAPPERRLAGAFLGTLFSAVLYLPIAYYTLTSIGHDVEPSRIPRDVWVLFITSAFVAGFLGHLFYFISVNTFDENTLKSASLLQHFGPVFSFLIAFALLQDTNHRGEFSFDYIYLSVFISLSLFIAYWYIKNKQ